MSALHRTTDPITSKMAASAVAPFAGTSQERTLWVASRLEDFTDAELVDKYASLVSKNQIRPTSPSRIRTSRSELVKQGFIEATGEVRKTQFGCDALVWTVVLDAA